MRIHRPLLTAIALCAISLAAPAEELDGDIKKGARVFKKCVSCHAIGEKAKTRIGPHMNDIVTRAIGGIDGFRYSKAMLKFAEENPIWTIELLDAYLENPRKIVRGGRMAFVGLRKEKDRRDVIAYMMSLSKKPHRADNRD